MKFLKRQIMQGLKQDGLVTSGRCITEADFHEGKGSSTIGGRGAIARERKKEREAKEKGAQKGRKKQNTRMKLWR